MNANAPANPVLPGSLLGAYPELRRRRAATQMAAASESLVGRNCLAHGAIGVIQAVEADGYVVAFSGGRKHKCNAKDVQIL